MTGEAAAVARLEQVTQRYQRAIALDAVTFRPAAWSG